MSVTEIQFALNLLSLDSHRATLLGASPRIASVKFGKLL